MLYYADLGDKYLILGFCGVFFFFFNKYIIIYYCFTFINYFLFLCIRVNQRMSEGLRNGEEMKASSEAMENSPTHSSKEGKRKRFWKKVKYQLVEYHSLPAYLKDNEFIVGHYRPEWPLKQILRSMFTIHNETLNVWT